MNNLGVSAATTPYAVARSTTGISSSTPVSNTSSTTPKMASSSTTPSSSTTANQAVTVATSSNTATLSSSTTYAYGSSASNSISRMVSSSTTPSMTSSSTTPSISSSSTTLPYGTLERNGGVITILSSSSTTPSVTSASTTPRVTSSSTTPNVMSASTTSSVTDIIITKDPYVGNVSETMRELMQMEYEYMSNPEEFAEHLEQEKQRIEELNSLKDEDVFAGMAYEEIIQYRYENAVNEKCKALYEKYMNGIDIVNYNEKGKNFYNFVTNNIRLNESDDMINLRGYAATYFHEVGHCMDDYSDSLMGISGNSAYDFYNVLKSDYEAFLNKVQAENGLTRDEAYVWISDWLNVDVHMKNAVADLLFGFSEGEIDVQYGHGENYYIKGNVEKEAFAHFFEAGMSYKPLKQMYIQELFPNAHKMFEQMITDELQEETYNIIPDRMIVV